MITNILKIVIFLFFIFSAGIITLSAQIGDCPSLDTLEEFTRKNVTGTFPGTIGTVGTVKYYSRQNGSDYEAVIVWSSLSDTNHALDIGVIRQTLTYSVINDITKNLSDSSECNVNIIFKTACFIQIGCWVVTHGLVINSCCDDSTDQPTGIFNYEGINYENWFW